MHFLCHITNMVQTELVYSPHRAQRQFVSSKIAIWKHVEEFVVRGTNAFCEEGLLDARPKVPDVG